MLSGLVQAVCTLVSYSLVMLLDCVLLIRCCFQGIILVIEVISCSHVSRDRSKRALLLMSRINHR